MNAPTSGRHRPQRGFTLIELMMAVACIGILASLALPSYQSYVYRAKASEVLLVIDKARTALAALQAERGVSIGRPLIVSFNPSGGPDEPALMGCVLPAAELSCGNSGMRPVTGMRQRELDFPHLGVHLAVSAGDSYMTKKPGQFKITVSEEPRFNQGSPAKRDAARQIVLAVHHELKNAAFASKLGTGSASLYFNLSGIQP
jgi:prepilin-type N-terminal cleavage/methylation domain-containing protein